MMALDLRCMHMFFLMTFMAMTRTVVYSTFYVQNQPAIGIL